MNGFPPNLERRGFLGAPTAASLGVVLKGSFAEFVRAQNAAQAGASVPGKAAKKSEFPENSTIVWCMRRGPTALVGATLFSLWSGAVLK
jgi:hypothetical protein